MTDQNWRPGLPVIAGFRFDRFPLNVATRPIRASDWLVVPLFIVGFAALLWMDRRGLIARIREGKRVVAGGKSKSGNKGK